MTHSYPGKELSQHTSWCVVPTLRQVLPPAKNLVEHLYPLSVWYCILKSCTLFPRPYRTMASTEKLLKGNALQWGTASPLYPHTILAQTVRTHVCSAHQFHCNPQHGMTPKPAQVSKKAPMSPASKTPLQMPHLPNSTASRPNLLTCALSENRFLLAQPCW